MKETFPMAFVTAPGKIEFRDHTPPSLGSEDVRLKVRAVTLCGSDLHIFKGRHPSVTLPVPVAHEIAGEVEAIGSQVVGLEPGDRVAVEPVIACGSCYFCKRGQYHLCTDISFQYRRGQGGLTPRFVVPARWAHKLPEHLSYEEGALLEPLSVALHAHRKSGLKVGDQTAIFGAGPIGLMAVQLARLAGAAQILVVDIQEHRLQAACSWGANQGINNLNGDAVQAIREATQDLGVDIAFEAVGLNSTLVQALQSVRKGGRVMLVGLFEQEEVSLPANIFVQKEIALLGSQGYNWDFQTAIALMEKTDPTGQIDLAGMISHRFRLDQAQQAFDVLMDPEQRAVKVVLRVEE